MTAASSGGAGDIVYAIPVMRRLGVHTIAVKRSYYQFPDKHLCQAVRRLLDCEGFTVIETSGDYPMHQFDPELKFDINLDDFRHRPQRGSIHIMLNTALQFGLSIHDWDWRNPWLTGVIARMDGPENIIQLTPRWRDRSRVDWKKVLQRISGTVGFIGFEHEHADFCAKYGNVPYLPTEDLYHAAQYVKFAKRVYCNQSAILTLAQGLGVEYWLERKPMKSNTLMKTKYEHLL